MFTLTFGTYSFPNQTFEVERYTTQSEVSSDRIPRAHGSKVQAPYLKERKIQVSGKLHNSTQAATETQFIAMQQALLFQVEKSFQMSSSKYINCYCEKIDPRPAQGTDRAVLEVDINLVAANPFFYSTGASYSFSGVVPAGVSNFSIDNNGTVFSEPIFNFYAATMTITDGVSVANLTNGKGMRYRGVVSRGTTLKINCETFEVLNNGVDGMSWFEGDFLTLEPGTNSLRAVGLTYTLGVDYKYRWF
jgi:phage-related protein